MKSRTMVQRTKRTKTRFQLQKGKPSRRKKQKRSQRQNRRPLQLYFSVLGHAGASFEEVHLKGFFAMQWHEASAQRRPGFDIDQGIARLFTSVYWPPVDG